LTFWASSLFALGGFLVVRRRRMACRASSLFASQGFQVLSTCMRIRARIGGQERKQLLTVLLPVSHVRSHSLCFLSLGCVPAIGFLFLGPCVLLLSLRLPLARLRSLCTLSRERILSRARILFCERSILSRELVGRFSFSSFLLSSLPDKGLLALPLCLHTRMVRLQLQSFCFLSCEQRGYSFFLGFS
jgi:hypothetical protein